ncbi:hypothetical protein FZC74_06740 [Sutcliffiella horikoshii]|uniref:Uncharacterized protein n=1 Tax=Sutcliffiella horikoshii TaxID=79883 RepID=A0AA94WP76_9BACI|nr:hypothetical protein [Sutcliffiella horikoshii]TYS59848.1 hypothetical protein FZC74_06740 [Sutcliffiella horikoshii]
MGCQEETVSETPNTANQEETKEEEVVEEAPVEDEETEEEIQEEETEEETPEEETVAAPMEWQGNWIISAEPFMFGNIRIYEETDEGFHFDIRTAAEQDFKEMKNIYAEKDGQVATSEAIETGCVLTFTMENEQVQVKESDECADSTIAVDFNHSFIMPDTYVIDEHFVASIKEGKLSPDGFGIGDSIDAVEQELGEPEAHISPNGGLFRIYSDIGYGTDVYGGDGTIGALMVVRPEERTPEEIKELLGEPEGEGISELDGFYYLYYIIEDKYKMYLDFDPEKKTLDRFSLGIL